MLVEDTRFTIGMASWQVEDGSVPKGGSIDQKKIGVYIKEIAREPIQNLLIRVLQVWHGYQILSGRR